MHPQHDKLADDASRYVDVEGLSWKPTPTPGIDMKVLMVDEATGLLTALFRWQPGTQLPLHEHVEVEQTYVLSGSIVDDEGEVREGGFVWAAQGQPPPRAFAQRRPGAVLLPEAQCVPRGRARGQGAEVSR